MNEKTSNTAAASGKNVDEGVNKTTRTNTLQKGNLKEGLDALLGSFGVEKVDTRDQVEEVVAQELQKRGHEASMVQLRYKVLLLSARSAAAKLIHYDEDNLLKALEEQLPGVVMEIKVKVTKK